MSFFFPSKTQFYCSEACSIRAIFVPLDKGVVRADFECGMSCVIRHKEVLLFGSRRLHRDDVIY